MKVEENQLYSRRGNLEIIGIPEENNELNEIYVTNRRPEQL